MHDWYKSKYLKYEQKNPNTKIDTFKVLFKASIEFYFTKEKKERKLARALFISKRI